MLGLARVLILGGQVVATDSSFESVASAYLERRSRPERVLDASRPILLLHGFCSSSRVLEPLARELEGVLGRKVVLVRSRGTRCDLREHAREVDRLLAQLAAAPDFEYADVVGHSMGGLVAAYLLKRLDRGRRIRTVLTLGAPHRGAPGARAFSMLFAGLSRVVSQMIPRSGFLEELKWLPVPRGCRLISVAGERDHIVPPFCTRLTLLPGQRNLCIPGAGHLQLVLSRGALAVVCCALTGEPEPSELEVLAA